MFLVCNIGQMQQLFNEPKKWFFAYNSEGVHATQNFHKQNR